ncbi:Biopolymer transport protein ExbD/TolR [Moritella viscosa]|uniref:ExbD/TolR family protein n=1 Tax=Moritella viscosa TaxID=80854 RepID=UPI0009124826|nr:biopolymer transporter ExbD [Moritella viscosa]SGZ10828.1 Biopolymer transport protein ExbD/TolR [Moritella viscosa]
MRHYHSLITPEKPDINMTPLIDIVFILLIFFLVSASFNNINNIDIKRPDSTVSDTKSAAHIVVSIDPKNNIWIKQKKIDVRLLKSEIKAQVLQHKQLSVVINADLTVTTGRLIDVLDQIRLAGVSNVAVATQTKA